MAFAPSHDLPGGQPITETSATQKHPLGTRIRAVDPVYGESEFIYLKGVASTVVGDAVLFDQRNGTTTRTVATSKGPLAIAMSANVANQYGWYAVAGAVQAKVLAGIAASSIPYVSATAGSLDDAVAAGQAVLGALFVSVDSGGFADIQLNHPNIGGL